MNIKKLFLGAALAVTSVPATAYQQVFTPPEPPLPCFAQRLQQQLGIAIVPAAKNVRSGSLGWTAMEGHGPSHLIDPETKSAIGPVDLYLYFKSGETSVYLTQDTPFPVRLTTKLAVAGEKISFAQNYRTEDRAPPKPPVIAYANGLKAMLSDMMAGNRDACLPYGLDFSPGRFLHELPQKPATPSPRGGSRPRPG